MKKLDNKELDQVTGGWLITYKESEILAHRGAEVGKYNLVVGRKYVIHSNEHSGYFIGVCTDSYESNIICGFTKRMHKFDLDTGINVTLEGDFSRVFEYI